MKKTNLFVTLGLTALLSTGLALPAIAVQTVNAGTDPETATVITDEATESTARITQGTTTVNVEAKAAALSVTIPTKLPIVFSATANGTATVPTVFKIKNNSTIGDISLNKLTLSKATGGTWDIDEATTTLANNEKKIRFKAGNSSSNLVATSSSAIDFSTQDAAKKFIIAAATDATHPGEQNLAFEVKGPNFTQAQTATDAFKMQMDFDWK